MTTSAFGIEHGEITKGLPRAVKEGGGGTYGSLMRLKNTRGKQGAMYSTMRGQAIAGGRQFKEGMKQAQVEHRVRNPAKSRGIRARLLNEDSTSRRRGFKTGKSSALDRHYRGRVNEMKDLP